MARRTARDGDEVESRPTSFVVRDDDAVAARRPGERALALYEQCEPITATSVAMGASEPTPLNRGMLTSAGAHPSTRGCSLLLNRQSCDWRHENVAKPSAAEQR